MGWYMTMVWYMPNMISILENHRNKQLKKRNPKENSKYKRYTKQKNKEM